MRIKGVNPEQAPAEALRLFEQSRERFGHVSAPQLAMAHRPEILSAVAALGAAISGSKIVEPRLKTLASLRAAQIAGCPF